MAKTAGSLHSMLPLTAVSSAALAVNGLCLAGSGVGHSYGAMRERSILCGPQAAADGLAHCGPVPTSAPGVTYRAQPAWCSGTGAPGHHHAPAHHCCI